MLWTPSPEAATATTLGRFMTSQGFETYDYLWNWPPGWMMWHAPDTMREVHEIPTTLSGRKLELPEKKIPQGADHDGDASRGSLRNQASLDQLIAAC